MIRLLRSAALARAVLLVLAAYTAVAAWLPWCDAGRSAPAWARALWLDRPFSSPVLLGAVLALFASTLACTWGKRARAAQVWAGRLPDAVELRGEAGRLSAFLSRQGFRPGGSIRRRFGLALFGGWILHAGLLLVVAGVLVEQAFHDGASFELTSGGQVELGGAGVLLDRSRGPFAPAEPPALRIALETFDLARHQPGYAPDRLSTIVVDGGAAGPRTFTIDRASGARYGGVDLYQAIPTGVALVLQPEGAAPVSVHLRSEGPRQAAATVEDASGRSVRLVATAERPLDDPLGTGPLTLRHVTSGAARTLTLGDEVALGGRRARLVGVTRWSGYTYARAPGTPAVFAGLAVVLLGCALLAFPAGVALLSGSGEDAVARVFVTRGADALRAEWAVEALAPERAAREER